MGRFRKRETCGMDSDFEVRVGETWKYRGSGGRLRTIQTQGWKSLRDIETDGDSDRET